MMTQLFGAAFIAQKSEGGRGDITALPAPPMDALEKLKYAYSAGY